ncbi:MAG TPA: class I SAM-dependent methyltransferase, partial [Burkholderiales bacterium]|nr:class I SAM-dependent methyltransferase [Burkholderiales bacterium]
MESKRKDTWSAGELYEPYVGRWSRVVAAEFLEWLGAERKLDWLDVGCGTGALTEVLFRTVRPRSVRGVDASAGFIDHARRYISDTRATFDVAD